jgi:hypothetical protein
MILLSHGTVICANNPTPNAGFVWYKLTPDPNGRFSSARFSLLRDITDAKARGF